MRVLVTGATGMIGSALAAYLTGREYEVVRLMRSGQCGTDCVWDPLQGRIELGGTGAIDAAVHLAGENIASGRWTAARKARIAGGGIRGTRLLAEALAELPVRPKVLISASAVGCYGDRGDQLLAESAGRGEGFLSRVVRDWEAATAPASDAGIRVVHLRLGMVLSAAGGALKKMLPAFRWCLGGVIGSGRQYVSWVSLDDVVRVVRYLLEAPAICGAVNAVAPEAVTNRELTMTLSRVLRRPAFAHMPAFVARLLFGQMADELLLSSTRAVPKALTDAGYCFQHRLLDGALRHILG